MSWCQSHEDFSSHLRSNVAFRSNSMLEFVRILGNVRAQLSKENTYSLSLMSSVPVCKLCCVLPSRPSNGIDFGCFAASFPEIFQCRVWLGQFCPLMKELQQCPLDPLSSRSLLHSRTRSRQPRSRTCAVRHQISHQDRKGSCVAACSCRSCTDVLQGTLRICVMGGRLKLNEERLHAGLIHVSVSKLLWRKRRMWANVRVRHSRVRGGERAMSRTASTINRLRTPASRNKTRLATRRYDWHCPPPTTSPNLYDLRQTSAKKL